MDPLVAATGWAEFLIVLGAAIFLSRSRIKERNLPRVAILSAGIFVAQILNFPIGGGTTGHLIGAALFAIMVGPALAVIGMSVVLLIQALMFGDGGVTALGLNALNMAIIAPLVGWGVYTLIDPMVKGRPRIGRWISVALAAWASVFVAAAACASELLVSYAISAGDYGIAANISVPAMLAYHAIIGAGEAAITVGLVSYLSSVSPELFSAIGSRTTSKPPAKWLTSDTARATLVILLVFALIVPLYIVYASEGRDGLEQTMAEAGAADGAPLLSAPFSYGETYLETLLAGILGFLIVSLAALAIMRLLKSPAGGDDPR
jgi:cobalt/nickel transport system permease protein